MARNDGVDRTSVRNLAVSDKAVGNTQQHNEREKDSYRNPDIVPQRAAWNVHFKKPTASYTDLFVQLETAGTISTRGLKPDATHYCELVFDVNSAYFDNHGGYEFAKQFYADAYKAAVQIVGGEQYILSAVMHADEINRATPRTQSSLLECMGERQITVDGITRPLSAPFFVIATQNPIEEEGTFNLPEAQMDRFMMKAVMTYPSPDEEARMLDMLTRRGSDMIGPDTITGERISVSDVDFLRKAARRVHVSDAIMRYAVDITATSRGAGSRPIKGLSSLVRLGASPRATIALTRIGQAKALLSGRDYVVPEDLKAFAHEVLRHRIMLTFEALADGVVSDQIVDKIVETVPVP